MKQLCVMSWNVNSIRMRLAQLVEILKTGQVDILLLQETKVLDADFPKAPIQELGYESFVLGQKAYNGVAVLSRLPVADIQQGLPKYDDEQARYLEVQLGVEHKQFRIASLYVPNGNPMEGGQGEKFLYKCSWLKALLRHAESLLAQEVPLCLGGDYNIIPQRQDVWDWEAFAGDALTAPFCRQAFGELLAAGFTDGLRLCQPEGELYSFWDYQGGAFRKNHGLRIDHLLLSPKAVDGLQASGALKENRALERPSDHVPVWAKFNL